MKLSFAAIATTFVATTQMPEVQAGLFGGKSAEDLVAKKKENTMWTAAGARGYYRGFYQAFYKEDLPADNAKCLNEETIDDVLAIQQLIFNPLSAFNDISNIQKDFNVFAQAAQVMENMSTCHFEKAAFDIMTLCTKDPHACSMATITQNMSKDMFALIGKTTSLSEVMQDFPSKDTEDFEDQMRELGATGGTWAKVIFNFHREGEE